MNRRRWSMLAFCVIVAGCASSGVHVTRSAQRDTPTSSTTDTTDPTSTTATGTIDTTVGTDGLPAIEPAVWSACMDQAAPWECATIAVPLDYDVNENDTDDIQVSIAMVRLPASDPSTRIGSLLLNPGGPGGSGIALALGEAQNYPQSMQDRFDIIGFDPRGVGASSALVCPVSFDPDTDSYDDCVPGNDDLLPYLGTPNVARDMEMIRRAVGDEQMTYLGYSYGTALGAVYADMFPSRVRAMALDGAVDPDAGLSNTSAGGIDFYADQDFDGTIEDFETLCDATPSCPAGPETAELISRVRRALGDLPTERFPSGGRLSRSDLDDIITDAMYSTYDWPVLAMALDDADDGDASTLAAFGSYLRYGYPRDVASEEDLEFANIAIRCADFSNRGNDSFDCEDFPPTDEALPVITAVDTSTPILVIGTKGDPATPARYAPLLADALGDAVSIEWEGAGHTATLTSRCITEIVADYLVELTVPDDGTTCAFVTGTSTLAEAGAVVFAGADRATTVDNLTGLFVALGENDDVAACTAQHMALRADRRMVVEQLLGIESAELDSLRAFAARACGD